MIGEALASVSSGPWLVVRLWTNRVWCLLLKVIQAPASPESLEMSVSNLLNIDSPEQRLPLPVRSHTPKISYLIHIKWIVKKKLFRTSPELRFSKMI